MEKAIIIIVILIVLYYAYISYYNEHFVTNFGPIINASVQKYQDDINHYYVCQIQQPQIGKNRPYVNWQKIHKYGDIPY